MVAEKAAWLIQVAKHLSVPIIAMGEDIEKMGSLNQAILDVLPQDTKIYNKDYFGLASNPEIVMTVEVTGRKTAVLLGMETDVCVAQSALGLMIMRRNWEQ